MSAKCQSQTLVLIRKPRSVAHHDPREKFLRHDGSARVGPPKVAALLDKMHEHFGNQPIGKLQRLPRIDATNVMEIAPYPVHSCRA